VKDIAKELNVSTSTVYKSFRGAGDINELTKQTILTAAQKLGYIEKPLRSSACRQRVGIFLLKKDRTMGYDHFVRSVITGFQQEAEPKLWQTLEVPVQIDSGKKFDYEGYLKSYRCSAGFLVSNSLDESLLLQLEKTERPTAILNNTVYNKKIACVGINDSQEIYIAVRHLADLGHKLIALICEKYVAGVTEKQILNFQMVMKRCGLCMEKNLIFQPSGSLTKDFVEQLMKSGATAVICANDWIAHDLTTELYRRNIRIPERISVVGLGDIPIARYTLPLLTTVRKNGIEVGKSACVAIEQILLQNYVNCILTTPELIVRESTGRLQD
ncbi:MAG TPA: LacI family DNA-binding transcriptional regulator, partial [Caproicibacter sp.]|nr:LacI family DNA-binding transcriptional regulator [Caproicibacter sp.]